MNREFGKLNGTEIGEYAPDGLIYGGRYHTNPTEAAYNAQGWLKIVDERPSPEDGYEWTPTRYEERDGRICRVYERVALPPPPPKVYNKYRLVCAVNEAHLLTELTAYMSAHAEAKMLWDAAQEFVADDPNFVSLVKQFNAAFGAETVAAILKAAEVA